MKTIKPKADYLIEIAYEVANRIGGAYAVLSTKCEEMVKYYGDNYYLIGPYIKKSADVEFEEEDPPPDLKNLFQKLEKEGIICHYGKWLIHCNPTTILVDFSKKIKDYSKIKKILQKKYGVDLTTDTGKLKQFDLNSKNLDVNKINLGLVWGFCSNILIKELIKLKENKDEFGVIHLHSYPSFSLIADLYNSKSKVGIVSTMHSTRLGRAIVSNGENLYKEVEEGLRKNRKVARKREYMYKGFIAYHQIEKVFAKYSDVITAVSEITSFEMEYILGKKADIVTPNGLNIEKYPTLEQRSIIHSKSKQKIYRFLNSYFLPYYPVDIKDSLLFFTSGRYELKTKGYEILIEAIGKLNDLLKKEDFKYNIFLFLFIMTTGKRIDEDILENRAIYDAIEHTVSDEFPHIEENIISSIIHGQEVKKGMLFDEHFLMESKKLMLKFKRKGNKNPPICAFKGLNKDDSIIRLLLKTGLDNKENDKIKVIFYPAPVSIDDRLLSMDYNEVVSGMHLGVFPSIYEPWGYTPLETAANGVMSITTDSAGFGKFILENNGQRKKPGILVVKSENSKRDDIISQLVKIMHWITTLSRKERIEKKMESYKLASLADWRNFAQYYIKAHNLAIERCKKRLKKS